MTSSKVEKIGKNDVISFIFNDEEIKKLGITKLQITAILESFVVVVRQNVKKNVKVSIYGLGTFWKSKIGSRLGVNPQTGEKIKIGSKKVPRFTASKTFKDWR